jgi:hypothetical protein
MSTPIKLSKHENCLAYANREKPNEEVKRGQSFERLSQRGEDIGLS